MNWIKRLFGIKEKKKPELEDFSSKKYKGCSILTQGYSGPMIRSYDKKGNLKSEHPYNGYDYPGRNNYDPITDPLSPINPLNPLSPLWVGNDNNEGYSHHNSSSDNTPSYDAPSHYSHDSSDYSSPSDSSSYDSGSSYDSSSSSDSSSSGGSDW